MLPRGLGWARDPIERALGVTAARAALGEAAYLEGRDFVERTLAALEIEPDRSTSSLGDIPSSGPLVVIANHHFGIVDALLALSLVLRVRPDLKVVANRSLAVFPHLRELTIPVSVPRAPRKDSGGARKLVRHLRAGGALLIFPAGRVAGRTRGGMAEDHPWSPGVGRLVGLSRAAVPLAFEGGNSRSFYFARRMHFRLGTLLRLRELLNKRGKRVPVRIGEPISYAEMSETPEPTEMTERLRRATYALLRAAPS